MYQDMPGLSLTAPQTARLLGLPRLLAAAALRLLEDAGFLVRTRDGRFLRTDSTTLPQGRMAREGIRAVLRGRRGRHESRERGGRQPPL